MGSGEFSGSCGSSAVTDSARASGSDSGVTSSGAVSWSFSSSFGLTGAFGLTWFDGVSLIPFLSASMNALSAIFWIFCFSAFS